MKIQEMRYASMILILAGLMNLTSCEVMIEEWYDHDNYSEAYYRNTKKLCSRTWQESWMQDGRIYTQRLDFYEDRTGTDVLLIEYRNGQISEERYTFRWTWDNATQTCLRMNYGPNDQSYFEDIWIGENTLTGILDDTEVHFTGIR